MKFISVLTNTINFWSRKPQNAGIVSRAKQYSGEYSQNLPYFRYYQYYHQWPFVKRNLNSLHRRWMGSSIEVQSQSPVFDKLWSTWSEVTNCVAKIKEAGLDALITGTFLLEKQFYGPTFANIEHIPTKTLWRIYRDEFGKYLSIWQLNDGDIKELSPDHMGVFTINNPERDAVGKSAMYAVAVPQFVAGKTDALGNPINPERYLPSILDTKARLNFAHMEIAEKQAKSQHFVTIKGLKDRERQKEIEARLEDEASSHFATVTSEDVEIKSMEFKNQVGNERYLEDVDNDINRATGFPGNIIDKGGEMGYASSQTPMQDLSSSVEDMQNDLSLFLEDFLFRPLCDQWGLDYEVVKPKWIFKTFVEKMTFEQMTNMLKIPDLPLAPTEKRDAIREFLPGLDDAEWEAFESEMKAMQEKQMQLEAGGKTNKSPRPDVEKDAPKPDKTVELHPLLKNPKALEEYIAQKAREYSAYFAMPPIDGEPYHSKKPEITDAVTLDMVWDMIAKSKTEGKAEKPEDEEPETESTEAARRNHIVAEFWDREDIKKELSKGIIVEMEHTSNPQEAAGIAMDHLVEDAQYYTKLAMVIKDVPKKAAEGTSKPHVFLSEYGHEPKTSAKYRSECQQCGLPKSDPIHNVKSKETRKKKNET